MSDSGDNDKRNNEEKSKGNWVWVLLISSTMLFLIFAIVYNNQLYKLEYPDLVALLEKTQYTQRGSGVLDEAKDGKLLIPSKRIKGRQEEISKLRDLRLDRNLIEGIVTYRLLDGEKEVSRAESVTFRTPKLDSEETTKQLRQLLNDSNVNWNFTDPPGVISTYLPLMLPVILVLAVILFMMRRLGGVGSPMSFARSRGRLYAQEDIGVTFNDVAGIDEAVEEVREVVDFLKHPDKYQRLGGRIPKGVLLVGPPGTGKTLLAKAIAGEAGVPFFSLSGSDFVEMFVGVGAARVRDMFQQATAKAPCIIFIDELDALGKSRAGNVPGSHDEREQTLNALLVEMDGFDANAGVIVMAATNRPETLDPALLRPGRFDRNVLVDRPDKQGREDILKVHVKHVKLGPRRGSQTDRFDHSWFCGCRSCEPR